MNTRKEVFANNECYHIFSRSIAGFKIFNNDTEYSRFISLLELIRHKNFTHRFSDFVDLDICTQEKIRKELIKENDTFVNIVSYCLMPTHFHLILQQEKEDGIVKYIGKVLNSYSKYFNKKYRRNGPLWSSRFKSVHIKDDEQLLHLTRYIHLNPTSAGLINKPEDWQYSSYTQFIEEGEIHIKCLTDIFFDIEPKKYKKFVNDRKSYQHDLSTIKSLIIEDYTG